MAGTFPGDKDLWSNSVCFNYRDQGLKYILGVIIFALHPFVGEVCSTEQFWLFEYMQQFIWATIFKNMWPQTNLFFYLSCYNT